MKRCKICGRDLPGKAFASDPKQYNWHTACRKCRYQRAKKLAKRRDEKQRSINAMFSAWGRQ